MANFVIHGWIRSRGAVLSYQLSDLVYAGGAQAGYSLYDIIEDM